MHCKIENGVLEEGADLEPATFGYEPDELPLLHPAPVTNIKKLLPP